MTLQNLNKECIGVTKCRAASLGISHADANPAKHHKRAKFRPVMNTMRTVTSFSVFLRSTGGPRGSNKQEGTENQTGGHRQWPTSSKVEFNQGRRGARRLSASAYIVVGMIYP